jgi:hypothetical protein
MITMAPIEAAKATMTVTVVFVVEEVAPLVAGTEEVELASGEVTVLTSVF